MEKQRLAELPDELLLKILSLLPMFEETVATRLISKRWEGPWNLAPDVMFDDKTCESFATFMSFVYGSLLSNDAQILERFHLKLSKNYSASDIHLWAQIAVNRSVRILRIDLFGKTLELPSCLFGKTLELPSCLFGKTLELPSCLSTCRTLKELTLVELSINESVASLLKICPVLECLVVDQQTKAEDLKISDIDVPTLRSFTIPYVRFDMFGKTQESSTCRTLKASTLHNLSIIKAAPRWFRLPSLKTLHLLSVKFLCAASVASFLKTCPVLECLVIEETKNEDFMEYNIDVPTLRSLSFRNVRQLSFDLLCKTLDRTCRTLKELTLHDLSIKFFSRGFRLPLLKTLHLLSVKFLGDASLASFSKPFLVLECLVIEETKDEDYMLSNIDVPTLSIRSVSLNSTCFAKP